MSKDPLQKWAKMFDHTLLRPQSTLGDVERLCSEAKEKKLFSVCVNPKWISRSKKLLEGTEVKVISVVGFPTGATTSSSKSFEASEAIQNGAQEIDMVMDIGAALDADWKLVTNDIRAVVKACGSTPLKVILETCYLTKEDIKLACECAVNAGAAFVKTSTGFGPHGARAEDVQLMRSCVGPHIGVKASGGIKTAAQFLVMLEAGANRIGSSASFIILEDLSRV